MSIKQCDWKYWVLIFMLNLIQVSNDTILSLRKRYLQINPIESLAYSSYTSIQIFHLLNWQQNGKIIESINSNENSTFQAAHNQFSYLSINEIYHQFLNLQSGQFQSLSTQLVSINNREVNPVPSSIFSNAYVRNQRYDWRNNLTSPVKAQGVCGACWAFAAAADIQTSYLLQYKIQIDFSEQQLIDCSSSFGNVGCSGGMMYNAYQYVINYGITLQSLYGYKQGKYKCTYDPNTMPHFTIKESRVIQNSCFQLIATLKQRPVSVVISANPSFVFYKSGVLNNCGNQINHALQLVGFVKNENENYYIGKNSWGTSWGELGFVYIDSSLQGGNLCNVCSYPQYPI